jgi:hypothetical protein
MKELAMRVRMLALALGTVALSLCSVAAFAADGGWRRDGRDQRQEYRNEYRPEYRRDYRPEYRPEYQRERWSERRDRCQDLRGRYERDRAHYYHELREGDWREAHELRERLQWTSAALARCGW